MTLYVGTSGYSYKEWKGRFYPETIASKEMLAYYASRLHAVELNNTFYRMPQPNMIESWKAQAPESFRFSVKAPQSITHFRRLSNARSQTEQMLKTVAALEDRLGAVIFRLPENMKKDLKRLETFLRELPADTPAVFDFRHPTWFDDEVVALLRSENRVFCISDIEELPESYTFKTAEWGYVRLRREHYTKAELVKWIKRIKAQNWKDTYVFFKHEDEGTGPRLAAQFKVLAAD
jgi:uncharacterized protein YecE (DUF72 family)